MEKWRVESFKDVISTPIFTLRHNRCTHAGKGLAHDFYSIKTYDWINIVAQTEEGRFIIVRQHRLGTDEITLETPGGLVEGDESPEETARRELTEETGYEAAELHCMARYSVNPAIMDNWISYYYAGRCVKTGAQRLDDAEDIEVLEATHAQVMEMIATGAIHHSLAVLAFLVFFQWEAGRACAADTSL